MKILLVSATELEIRPLLRVLSCPEGDRSFKNLSRGRHSVDILITGVGIAATAFHLGRAFQENRYDLAVNLGIAGAFNHPGQAGEGLEIGQVAWVVTDRFADMGVEGEEGFQSLVELGLGEEGDFYFDFSAPHSLLDLSGNAILKSLPRVTGITVNKIETRPEAIKKLEESFRPHVESMEGAAFMYACRQAKVPGLQLRAVSNVVGERDKKKWNIPLAVENLNRAILNFQQT